MSLTPPDPPSAAGLPPARPPVPASEIARLLDAPLEPGEGPEPAIAGVRELRSAGPEQAAFYQPGGAGPLDRGAPGEEELAASRAGLFLLPPGIELPGRWILRTPAPQLAAARLQEWFHPEPSPRAGIHPAAVVAAGARVHPSAEIGPGCVIEDGAEVGEEARLVARVYLGEGVRVGARTVLHAGVVLERGVCVGSDCRIHANAVLGADGFGYVFDGERHRRFPQTGTVVVEDDVEIGAGTCIDRATFGATRIGAGSRIDNLVQIGHNCVLGRRVILCGQVGLAGSTQIGDDSILGGKAGTGGHLTLGRGVQVAALSGIAADVPDGSRIAGAPAWDLEKELRARALWRRMVRDAERRRREP